MSKVNLKPLNFSIAKTSETNVLWQILLTFTFRNSLKYSRIEIFK